MSSDVVRVRLRLRQVRVLGVVSDTPFELVVEVCSAVRRPRCAECGAACGAVHDVRSKRVRDLEVSGRPAAQPGVPGTFGAQISMRKRHRYVTVIVNGDTGRTMAMVEHRAEPVLEQASGGLARQSTNRFARRFELGDEAAQLGVAAQRRVAERRHIVVELSHETLLHQVFAHRREGHYASAAKRLNERPRPRLQGREPGPHMGNQPGLAAWVPQRRALRNRGDIDRRNRRNRETRAAASHRRPDPNRLSLRHYGLHSHR